MIDFSITTRVTEKEYSKVLFISLYKRPRTIIFSILGVMIILGALRVLPFYDNASYLEFFIGLYFLLFPLMSVLRYLKHFRTTQTFQHEITFTFSENGFIVEGPASRTEMQWEIMRGKEISKFLILYDNGAVGNYIDKTKLTNEQLQFIRSKVKAG